MTGPLILMMVLAFYVRFQAGTVLAIDGILLMIGAVSMLQFEDNAQPRLTNSSYSTSAFSPRIMFSPAMVSVTGSSQ